MGRARIDYTNKDYDSLRRELLRRIPQLTDRWTDFSPSDLGVVLLELFCGIGDMLAYYLDAQAAEAFLPTARQRHNVIQLCRLISYRLDGPVAATTVLRFTLAAPLDEDLPLPAGTAASALLEDGEVEFETVEEAVLSRGTLKVEVGARQGLRKEEVFSATGQPHASISLAGTDIAQDSIRLSVQQQTWSEVAHFQDSGRDDGHFQVDTDGLDRTRVFFGDGVRGALPAAGAPIRVEFLETLGAAGNLQAHLVTSMLSPIRHQGEPVPLSVTNPVPATGGSERERLEHARRQAPAEVRSLWRALTKDDYQALAEGYPGVAKAQVLDVTDCGNIRYYEPVGSATGRQSERKLPPCLDGARSAVRPASALGSGSARQDCPSRSGSCFYQPCMVAATAAHRTRSGLVHRARSSRQSVDGVLLGAFQDREPVPHSRSPDPIRRHRADPRPYRLLQPRSSALVPRSDLAVDGPGSCSEPERPRQRTRSAKIRYDGQAQRRF